MINNDHPVSLSAGIYIVSTPIGNLGDITLRAIETLRACTSVACEDTRVTRRLLKHIGFTKPLVKYNDHSTAEERAELIQRASVEPIALVSDAGTPLISDPGYQLIRSARAMGINVTAIPGACAAITALTIAGLPSDKFLFGGFLPTKEKGKLDVLKELTDIGVTLIFYESAPRLVKTLNIIANIWPDRQVAVARELTKLYENCVSGTASNILEFYTQTDPRGEIVVILEPCREMKEEVDLDLLLRNALRIMKPSNAAAEVSKMTKVDRKTLYTRALELKNK